jgi:hypothetical protein
MRFFCMENRMSLHQMLKSLPLNREEAFFTATVLPGIICCDNFAYFPTFLDVLGLRDIMIDVRPETANILFFTEYSIAEAAAPKAVRERFSSVNLNSKERPDLLIRIDHGRAIRLIAIEAKMFSAIHPKRLETQMRAQRTKVLEPLGTLLDAEITHLALLPLELVKAWKTDKTCRDAFEAISTAVIQVVTWEDIVAPFKDRGLATYWTALLDTALSDFPNLAAKIGRHMNNDDILRGSEIVERFGSDEFKYQMMGRDRGLDGPFAKHDIESGSWKMREYEVKEDNTPIRNWFAISDFILRIAQQSAKT